MLYFTVKNLSRGINEIIRQQPSYVLRNYDWEQMQTVMALILSLGQATYHVKYTLKKVEATSVEMKGKINCDTKICEFLLAIPIKSFESSDSNRDLNMLQITEASKYPIASAKGTFPKEVLTQENAKIEAEVDFHGVKKNYTIALKEKFQKASFVLDLDGHKIERPSLFRIKIKNEMPLDFVMKWTETSK